MKLRPYQNEAVDALYKYLEECDRNGVIILPTGTGKSILIAEPARHFVSNYTQPRIIVATHSQELVGQNFQELIRLWPEAPAGVYSAGLGQRNTRERILFVGIQSVFDKAYLLQRCDILFVDEAHTISRKDETMWGQFIGELMTINPRMRVIGLSATAFRMDSGSIVGGEGALFQDIIYEYNILDAFNDGYLCEVIPKNMGTKLDVSGVHKRGGEFIEKELQAAVNIDAITRAAVDEIFDWGHNRRAWLIFGSGVEHAIAISEEITRRGVECAYITGKTPKPERAATIAAFKAGRIRALANNKVLTTGFNVPGIDLIADLNPTMSAGLFVQKVGRGTRPVYAPGYDLETTEGRLAAMSASVKPNCLLLDFANNLPRHGHIDKIKGKAPPTGGGIAPIKPCPGRLPDATLCATVLHAAVMLCPVCGHRFPEPELKIVPVANDHAVLSTQEQRKIKPVRSIRYNLHKKAGGVDSLRVEYLHEDLSKTNEWICLQHNPGSIAQQKAKAWWKRRTEGTALAHMPLPQTIREALPLCGELLTAYELVVVKEGKFDRIIGYAFDSRKLPVFIDTELNEWGFKEKAKEQPQGETLADYDDIAVF